MLFTRAKQGLGLVFVAGFAAVWIYFGIKVLQFTPDDTLALVMAATASRRLLSSASCRHCARLDPISS